MGQEEERGRWVLLLAGRGGPKSLNGRCGALDNYTQYFAYVCGIGQDAAVPRQAPSLTSVGTYNPRNKGMAGHWRVCEVEANRVC